MIKSEIVNKDNKSPLKQVNVEIKGNNEDVIMEFSGVIDGMLSEYFYDIPDALLEFINFCIEQHSTIYSKDKEEIEEEKGVVIKTND